MTKLRIPVTYRVTVDSTIGGYTDMDGIQDVNEGEPLTITATPNANYEFREWSDDVEGSENPLTVTVTSDMEITANFAYSLESTTGTGSIFIDYSTNPEMLLLNVQSLDASNPELNQDGKPEGYDFKDGLVAFRATKLMFGSTIQINITFPSTLNGNEKFYKVDDDGFYEFDNVTINGNTVILTLTDGGPDDQDGTVNGEIDDPFGVAWPASSGGSSGGGGGGSGGCFINIVAK